jgi:hypothetical protein
MLFPQKNSILYRGTFFLLIEVVFGVLRLCACILCLRVWMEQQAQGMETEKTEVL